MPGNCKRQQAAKARVEWPWRNFKVMIFGSTCAFTGVWLNNFRVPQSFLEAILRLAKIVKQPRRSSKRRRPELSGKALSCPCHRFEMVVEEFPFALGAGRRVGEGLNHPYR